MTFECAAEHKSSYGWEETRLSAKSDALYGGFQGCYLAKKIRKNVGHYILEGVKVKRMREANPLAFACRNLDIQEGSDFPRRLPPEILTIQWEP